METDDSALNGLVEVSKHRIFQPWGNGVDNIPLPENRTSLQSVGTKLEQQHVRVGNWD
jgi:hypothetical protein